MKLFLFTILLFLPPVLVAECVINGETYPEDAVVNGYKCEDGEWQKTDG